MDDYTKILPKMLSGDGLVKALSVVPKYDENSKNMDVGEKLIALSNLYDIYIPSKMSIEIYNKLYLSLYHSLKKKSSKLASQQRYENYKRFLTGNSNSIIGGSDSFTIIGSSGIGKSTAVNRAVDVIVENCKYDCNLFSDIIPFVTVQCPFDSSVKGLAIEILMKINSMLKTQYLNGKIIDKCTTDALISQISTIAMNNIGVLIIDEIQNVANSKNGKNIIGFLTQLINNSGISICMVGTPESVLFFEGAEHLARRTMGLKYTALSYDEYFKNICNILFRYQYTIKNATINEEFYKWIYDHSCGNISIVISLLHDAQEIAIMSGVSKININILNEAYQNRIEMYHKFIQPSINKVDKKKNKHIVSDRTNNITQDCVIKEFNNIETILKISKEKNIDFIKLLKQSIIVEEIKI